MSLTYLLISQLLLSVLLTGIFCVVWRTVESKTYTLLWTLVYALVMLNAVLQLLLHVTEYQETLRLAVHLCFLLQQGLMYSGFRLRAGKKPTTWLFVSTLVIVALAVVWFTLITPHSGLKMSLSHFCGALMVMAIALNVTLPGRPARPAEWGTILLFFIYGLSLVASGTAAIMQGAEYDLAFMEHYYQITLIAQPVALAGTGLFIVLLLADDLAERLKTQAITDQLTDVPNRRGFEIAAQKALAMARRKQTPCCVVVADIDYFKRINDDYGHMFGDFAIQSFTRQLQDNLRDTDIIGRIGGEEFVILMQDTTLPHCLEVTERLRSAVEKASISLDNKLIEITASFGITRLGDKQTLKAAIHDADKALYKAKDKGRNCIEVFG